MSGKIQAYMWKMFRIDALLRKELMMEFSNTDWLTLLLILITGFYAWATFEILKANKAVVNEMKEQTSAHVRPYIVVSATPRAGASVIDLEIMNTGRSPAQSLKLKINKDFYFNGRELDSDNISKLPAFTSIIDSMAPNTKLTFMLGAASTIFSIDKTSEKCPLRFEISADYSFSNKTYSELSIIDLRPLLHSVVPFEPISDEIKKLRQSIEKLIKSK